MNKIAFLTGTRAEFGLMQNILKYIVTDPEIDLYIYATGMHLMQEFGYTINQVKKKFPQTKIIDSVYKKDDRASMAIFVGDCLAKITKEYSLVKPDIVLTLGDRGGQLASAIAAKYLNILLVHLHGGEFSGTVDNIIRFTISELADYHFTSTKKSAENLKAKGISDDKIFIVGAPGLDEIVKLPKREIKKQIVVLQHPAENEFEADNQIKTTLEAALSFNLPVFVIFPNADAGGRKMIKVIEEFALKNPLIKPFRSLPRSKFLHILSESAVLAGNSSSGIIESASLKIPVVDIGERQKNREKGLNILHTGYKKAEIINAVKKALYDNDFLKKIKTIKNPYGDGNTSELVLKLLKQLVYYEQIF